MRALSRTLKLTKPLAVLDLETTGAVLQLDRVVEIAILKIYPDGRRATLHERLNPGCPIPPEATAIHGIDNADVRDCPTFKNVAAKIARFLKSCDLAGYNLIRFDLPLLQAEFSRAEFDFSFKGCRIVDACHIFIKKEPRDLTAALKLFCNEDRSQAHSALHDVYSCWKVLAAQLRRYTDLPLDMQGLHTFCNDRDERFVDASRRFEWRHNKAAFAFGKHRGRPLEDVAREDPDFLKWMLEADFPVEAKAIASAALKGKFPGRTVSPKSGQQGHSES